MAGLEDQLTRRIRWYAALLAATVVSWAVVPDVAWVPELALAVVALLAWGPSQAHVTLNPALDRIGRRRWRVVLWCLPGGLLLYWDRHRRRPVD